MKKNHEVGDKKLRQMESTQIRLSGFDTTGFKETSHTPHNIGRNPRPWNKIILYSLVGVSVIGVFYIIGSSMMITGTTDHKTPVAQNPAQSDGANQSKDPGNHSATPSTPTEKPNTVNNVIRNASFEEGLANWSSWTPNGQQTIHYFTEDSPFEGKQSIVYSSDQNYQQNTYQKVNNLPDGSYVARVWLRSSGGQKHVQLQVTDYDTSMDDENVVVDMGDKAIPDNWTEIQTSKIQVKGGSATIGVYSEAGSKNWIVFDKIEFYRVE